jgi:two-component system, NarL family, nitrate/nitrite response regulator NarL
MSCDPGLRPTPLKAVIVSETRILSESLVKAFVGDARISILGYCSTTSEALDSIIDSTADVVLFDAAFPNGAPVVANIRAATPWVRVVVLALNETEDNVVIWTKAGAIGYVANNTPLSELNDQVADIVQGKQACSAHVAGALLRRIAIAGLAATGSPSSPTLTHREREILRLVGAGLSNKDIARRLNISLATTKAHVHNLLGKLNVRRRGEATAWVHDQNNNLDTRGQQRRSAGSVNGQHLSRLPTD